MQKAGILYRYPHRHIGKPIHYRKLLLFFLLALGCTAALLTVELKLRPLVYSYAEGRASYLASKAVNEAVQEELESAGGVYDRLIFFEKSPDGMAILAVKTDSVAINRFKAAVVDQVSEKMQRQKDTVIEIPMGNLWGGELLSGRGPRISVVLQMVQSAKAEFISQFDQAGINQTRHRLLLEVQANVTMLLPVGKATFPVVTQVNLAETILVGDVPESYTDIVDTDGSTADQFSNYAK